jgi:hypothetical protein
MNRMISAIAGLSMVLLGVAAAPQDGAMPKPAKEHEWLKQIAGEWESEGEAILAPDQPPMKIKGTESGRMVGGFWVTVEHKGEFMGAPFTGIMTLGYDPEKKKFVGTWVDSMGSYLWQYVGTLDESGKVLTLESEGPSHEGPGKLAKFRESIEIKGKDEKVFVSRIEKDGKWVTALTMTSKRKK